MESKNIRMGFVCSFEERRAIRGIVAFRGLTFRSMSHFIRCAVIEKIRMEETMATKNFHSGVLK